MKALSIFAVALIASLSLIAPAAADEEVGEVVYEEVWLLDEAADAESSAEAIAAPADDCFTLDVQRCCTAAKAQLSVPCDVDGVQWTCHASVPPGGNPLFQNTKKSKRGWESSALTGNTVQCKYHKVSCGTSPRRCLWEQAQTVLTCAERKVAGALCESPADTSE